MEKKVYRKYQHYLSFGFNCEVSFALKHVDVFEPSVFAWADVRGTAALIRGIENTEKMLGGKYHRYSRNMFFCDDYQIGFHGRLNFDEAKLPDGSYNDELITESLNELRTRLSYLEERQRKSFEDGRVLVVFKYFSDIFEEKDGPIKSAALLRDCLKNKYYGSSFDVLCVLANGLSIPDIPGDSLFFRTLPRFSPRNAAAEIDAEAWAHLLHEFIQEGGDPIVTADKGAELKQKIAEYWSKPRGGGGVRWWSNQHIIRHVNYLVCGEYLDGMSAGLHKKMFSKIGGVARKRGISVGVGNAAKELKLLQLGLVEHFDCFELSQTRVDEGRKAAELMGLGDRISFHVRDVMCEVIEPKYDLVYWDSALHHMPDCREALDWSKRCLVQNGLLVVHDFVGPSRFQWSDYQLDVASRVRQLLPKEFLIHPLTGAAIPTLIKRPSIESMIASDPSEAADSSSILPALREHFPHVEIILTGGVIYHSALNDVMANFDPVKDKTLMDSLLLLDEALARKGETHFAVAFAYKD